ncbi:MAG: hypothetical protein IH936_04850 [Acidobacteria bacterium]|nr:hypothetical protein [Acidobacteriota bacterium]
MKRVKVATTTGEERTPSGKALRLLFLGFYSACAVWAVAGALTTVAHAAADPRAVAERYVTASLSEDHEALYALNYREQAKAQEVRNTKPQVLWEELLGNLKESFRQSRDARRGQEVSRMLALGPSPRFLEAREEISGMPPRAQTVAWYQFSYTDVTRSPLHVRFSGDPKGVDGIVKTWIAEVHVDNLSGLVTSFTALSDSTKRWPESLPRIFSLRRDGLGKAIAYITGGEPPYSGMVECGGTGYPGTSDRRLKFQLRSAAGECRITVTDVLGQSDETWMSLRRLPKPRRSLDELTAMLTIDWYGREPWFSSGYRGVLFGHLRKSVSAFVDKERER